MKKTYEAPDMEVFRISLEDVILTSPTEGDIPSQGNLDPPELPTDPGGEIDF